MNNVLGKCMTCSGGEGPTKVLCPEGGERQACDTHRVGNVVPQGHLLDLDQLHHRV